MKNRYMLIGANPFQTYTGTVTYTGLGVQASCQTIEEAKELWDKYYNSCGGLLLVLDTRTGTEALIHTYD